MKTVAFEIRLLSYWHAGSGEGRGGHIDAIVRRDRHGLPYLPGKSVKGLLREGVMITEEYRAAAPGTTISLFGEPTVQGEHKDCRPGALAFCDAVLDTITHEAVRNEALSAGLYDVFSSTAIQERSGVTKDKSLRTIEVTVPVALVTYVSGPGEIQGVEDWVKTLELAAKLTRGLGSHRQRGLGRCAWTILEPAGKENPHG